MKKNITFRNSLAITSAILMSACATVQTRTTNDFEFKSSHSSGLTYFLPKRFVKLKVVAEPLKASKIKKDLAAAKKAQETVQAKVKAFEATIKIEQERLKTLTNPEAIKAAQTKIDNNTTDLLLERVKLLKENAKVQGLQENYILAQNSNGECKYTISSSLTDPVPDVEKKFIARPFHNPLRDDVQTFKVSNKGLLTSANVTATDRSADVIVEIAGAIASLGGSGGFDEDGNPVEDSSEVKCPIIASEHIFDPIDQSNIDEINRKLHINKFGLQIDDVDLLGAPSITKATPIAVKGRLTPNEEDGLYYRTPIPILVSYSRCSLEETPESERDSDVSGDQPRCDPATVQAVSATLAMIPQAGPVSYIPMRSSAFVKTVDDVTFENGTITGWTNNRPSEALEIVRLPVKILRSVISVPAEILSLKIDYSSKEESYAAQQALLISQDIKNQSLLKCLDQAGESDALALACLPPAAITSSTETE